MNLLINLWSANDYAEEIAGLIRISSNYMKELLGRKKSFESISKTPGIMEMYFWDYSLELLTSLPEDDERFSDLLNSMYENKWVKIEDDLLRQIDDEYFYRKDYGRLVVDGEGVHWVAVPKHTTYQIETPRIPWEELSRLLDPEPQHNDGRMYCWWCGAETIKQEMYTSLTDFCKRCQK